MITPNGADNNEHDVMGDLLSRQGWLKYTTIGYENWIRGIIALGTSVLCTTVNKMLEWFIHQSRQLFNLNTFQSIVAMTRITIRRAFYIFALLCLR